MCGIFAIISKKNLVVDKLLKGLKNLEYRGYDSSGIAILKKNEIHIRKAIGKIINLENKIKNDSDFNSNVGIAHTRWATHGEANELNAHPHICSFNNFAVVHNGIIENYKELKTKLIAEGFTFKSQTDTEIIANLISYNFQKLNDLEKAFFQTINELTGSFGIAIIKKQENKILVAKKGSPLIIGLNDEFFVVTSSPSALFGLTNKIITLLDNECAILTLDECKIYNFQGKIIEKLTETIDVDDITISKGDFEHFMLKEIYEQPEVIKRTIAEYVDVTNKKIILPNFNFDLATIETFNIIACGTSYYAGCIAKYFLEQLTHIFVNVDIASEFKYRGTPIKENTMSVFISQSGETADTIGALKYCQEKGQKIIALVNVLQSNISSLSDIVLKTVAGVEIGVASTKAFTGQISVLYLLALEIARIKQTISQEEFEIKLSDFIKLPKLLTNLLKDEKLINNIKAISEELSKTNHILYLGRDLLYPLALEGSLKIKEISYIPSQGIASGELKHGPIALIDKNSYIVCLVSKNILFDKSVSNIEEISARKGKIILISDEKTNKHLKDNIYKSIDLPASEEKFTDLIYSLIPLQLLAYYTALTKDLDIDKPRNLAKSVTVE